MSDSNDDDRIYQRLQTFCGINEQFAVAFKTIETNSLSRCQKVQSLLQYLARIVINIPEFTQEVITFSLEMLPKIINISLNFNGGVFDNNHHIQNCILLGKLIQLRPDFTGYATEYFESHPSPFIEEIDQTPRKKSKMSLPIFSDLALVESCFSLLKSNPRFYRTKWNWSEFLQKYLNHNSEPEVKWIASHCLAMVSGMSEEQLNNLIISKINSNQNISFSCIYYKNHTLSKLNKNGIGTNRNPHISSLKTQGVSSEVIEICGVYIPKIQSSQNPKKIDLIQVESTRNNLKKIAMSLSSNSKAICLQGPVGSGKTTLIEYLASKSGRILGENFIKVQLGDQTDSKMLLGTYRCTDIPGEFIWQPGVVTQAVLDGNWLLLEDIDSASMDIASVLSSLLENGTLAVPGYRDSLIIRPGFQLFFTQRLISTRTGHHRTHSNAMTLLEKHLTQINIDPLTNQELQTILTTLYPKFTKLSDRILRVFGLFSRNDDITSYKMGRLISTRDFFKWLSRAAINFQVSSESSSLKILQDAIDVFCCSFPDRKEALALAREISSILGIINEKADFFFDNYKPDMKLTQDALIVGRSEIKRNNDTIVASKSSFYFTRPSAILLERIICCISLNEPVLLVGETGTGKTSSIQYLANVIGQKLIVINMNQQSDSADLLGGYKPVDLKFIVAPIRRQFEHVFCDYFQIEPNKKFLGHIAYCFNENRWNDLVKLMTKSYEAALKRLINEPNSSMLIRWQMIGEKLHKLKAQIKTNTLAFSFIEGSLVKAVELGHWVLLDEINLANAETLECLSGLLEGPDSSLNLLERGDHKPIKRHENFILFACMNPSTDVGKKDLPSGLRNRFTEFFVDELTEKTDLLLLTSSYLNAQSLTQQELNKIVDFYLMVRKEAVRSLSDGLGHCPHFSLRSLCRALMIAATNPCGNFKRSLYESFCLSFLTQLDAASYKTVELMIAAKLIGGYDSKMLKSIMRQPIPAPNKDTEHYLQFEGYWIKKGSLDSVTPADYILTDSVRTNLKDLVRVVSIGRLPVLLQGDTSVGKTSLIQYLAKSSGNKCVRINNHEHTDLQEYIGSYAADSDGKLVFREGVLVEAMRKGHWIILDELNLAPTDVLEALNRVLDDNRELFIPETQETVKADYNFMLFATQNPPGSYGGRKMLSRAFRNRFVELHFNEIPPKELAFILHQRCQMAPSYSKKMIAVMSDLQMRRRGSAAFAGKQGFITLRDLFRWGERYRLAQNSEKLYDWDQHLADEGYLVLAGRVRKSEEKKEIIEVLEKHLKRVVDPQNLFTLSDKTSTVTQKILEKIEKNKEIDPNIVWTFNMRQLAVLVSKAFEFQEPVLLVGDTGGGKTTVCQLIADRNDQKLLTVNCHMHTESSDFIGGLRPVRDHSDSNSNKPFEWVDGPLIQSMVNGDIFLADEISLADDSVLERLNSLLEPERTLLLAEKGSDLNNSKNSESIYADDRFRFIGTMNPGGDFGKKELSPALRNRFTEIWCESCTNRTDLISIIEQNIEKGISFGNQQDGSSGIGALILDFIEFFNTTQIGARFTISIRDILTWVQFINVCAKEIEVHNAYLHGACLTFLDGLGSGITAAENRASLKKLNSDSIAFLTKQVRSYSTSFCNLSETKLEVKTKGDSFGIEPFFVEIGTDSTQKVDFSFNAPTTMYNTLRLLRGMQLHKAILLEGSPGVGKTSLVTALAKITKHKIFRINLSDQTDISDLFGADLPVEGGTGGQFSWRDGPLLQALKKGDWILLDELNLASQSVLEGLNACLDHRGEIFIPELGKTFHVKPGTRFFACQNPLKQGGSRRGLPRSFLNRFVQVYVDSLNYYDLQKILSNQFTELPHDLLKKMLDFNFKVCEELEKHNFGHKGAPWELNLRDVTRWCEATIYHYRKNGMLQYRPENLVQLIYADRMRTLDDKLKIGKVFREVFACELSGDGPILYVNNSSKVWLGDVSLNRDDCGLNFSDVEGSLVLRSQLQSLRSLAYCVNLNWMAILVGNAASGKSALVKTLANLAGRSLKTLPVTSAMDTTDILGGFEQTDYARHLEEVVKETERLVLERLQVHLAKGRDRDATGLLRIWENYVNTTQGTTDHHQTMEEETKLFLKKLETLHKVWLSLNKNDVVLLRAKAEIMKECVNNEGSLNAGGKFEWVDSVLIKCLQKGDWLLIDNVNLCSAAVLDRLNGLLEPNGVLTISERGVDSDGKMIEIKPNPKFRLFLTMDPKNGEISRAMRNRGIEIYLLNEKASKACDDYDVKSLISWNGLKNQFHINYLLDLHDFTCNLILGDAPNINDLLRAARTISQLLQNGEKPEIAFTTTLIEVYYKTRSKMQFECGDNYKELIGNRIRLAFDQVELENYWFDDCMTLKTRNLRICSNLEKVRQQFSLISKFLDWEGDFVRFLVVNYYSITSLDDLEIRYCYSNDYLQSNQFLQGVSSVLYSFLTDLKLNNDNFPIDSRWLPETPHSDENSSRNVKILSLHLISMFYQENYQRSHNKNEKNITLYDYMKLRQSQKVDDQFDDYLIDQFLNLIEEYDNYLMNSLKSAELSIQDDDCIEILDLITWRLILMRCTGINVKKMKLNEVKTKLKIHYRWFCKYSLNKIHSILNLKVSPKLERMVMIIDDKLQNQFSTLHKLSKHYHKIDHRPLPKTSQEQIDFSTSFARIEAEFDVCGRNPNFGKIISVFEDENLKKLLLNPTRASLDLVELSSKCDDRTIDLKSLPFCDYFVQIIVRKSLVSCGYSENSQIFKRNHTIPTDLVRNLNKFEQSKDLKEKHELVRSFFKYFINSVCIRSPNHTLTISNPILIHNLMNLLINDENVTKLSNFKENGRLHRLIHLTLWRNLTQLNDDNYDFFKGELAYLRSAFDDFIELFSQAVGLDKSSDVNLIIDTLGLLKIDDVFIKLFKFFIEIHGGLDDLPNIENTIRVVSLLHLNLGYLKALINSKLSLIDPSAKKFLKKEYCLENLAHFEDLSRSYVTVNQVYSGNPRTVHSLNEPTLYKIQKLNDKRDLLENYVAFRPNNNITYEKLLDLINHGFSTILFPKSMLELLENLADLTKIDDLNKFAKQLDSKILSCDNLLEDWIRYSSSYPDIVDPLLSNITQLLYGLKLCSGLVRKLIIRRKYKKFGFDVQRKLVDLVKSPSIQRNQVEFYLDEKFTSFLESILQNDESPDLYKQESLKLYKCGFQETYNSNLIDAKLSLDCLRREFFVRFDQLLRKFVGIWDKQEKECEIKESEADSLYKTKTKCQDKPEEEQISDELKELFPNYHDLDFRDFQKNSSQADDDMIDKGKTFSGYITEKDVKFALDLHIDLVINFTKSEWLNPLKNKNLGPDFITPLVEKFKLFKLLCDKSIHCLDYTVDKELLGSVNVLLLFVRNCGNSSEFLSDNSSPFRHSTKKNYDFYKDPNVEEVKSSSHILEGLRLRISQLLEEWPDQPTLKTIQTIIDRVYSFDISSPLSRFLTGLEILLEKCKEWEEVAHSGVTLAQHSQELTHQIITWRKIELNFWKDLLNSTFDRVNESVYKWWLHLYKIMEQFIDENRFTNDELIETLQTFIVKSNLGEFQKRLQLFYVFHCHCLYLKRTKQSDAFINILWNLYSYFKQFESNVIDKIKNSRAPIEKKLKDYVKIVKWKDINYWAIKDTVDKSHKTLHKYVREFQEILRQAVSPCLVNSTTGNKMENVGIWDRPQRHSVKTYHYTLDPATYMAKDSLRKKIIESSHVTKIDSYFTKSRKLCKEAIAKTQYPTLIQSLDTFVGDVIETSSHLQNLEVDTTLPKEKQKSHAKSILQQKHRALADLFKNLSKMGLSFRTGLVESRLKTESDVYLLKPVDISASFHHINYNRVDEKILTIWDSCEMYYLRSLMRTHVLDTAFKSPAPDLGIANIERCKGFTSHLMNLNHMQKRELIETSRNFYYLRHFTTQFETICDAKQFIAIRIVKEIQNVLADILKVTNQLDLILQTCPDDEFGSEVGLVEVIILKAASHNLPKYKHDAIWNRASKLLSEIVNIAIKISNNFEKCKGAIPATEIDLISLEFIPISDSYLIDGSIDELIHNIDAFMTIFEEISFCDSLQQLRVRMAELKNSLNIEETTHGSENGEDLRNFVNSLTEKILIVIQNMFKKYSQQENNIAGRDEDDAIEDGHLNGCIVGSLLADSKLLKSEEILESVREIASVFFKLPLNQLEESKPIISQILPLLEQLILLYQYFLTQQVSAYRVTCKMNAILLNIFIDLASNGFCVPPGFAEGNNEEGVSKPSDGLGLGDGQGEKDVSDKIESEDQLDDAQPSGQDKEQKEDPDCNEESGGIEMSDDFDSKLQDVDRKDDEDDNDDDDDDDDDDDEDADEQMGETGKDSDKLDQEIWGSDKEEDENEDNRDEEGNRGDKESEEQLGAKDDDRKPQNDNKENKNSNEEREENQKEINEMKEPEFDEEQTDPYHGNQPELPEPEPMDLPDDLQLDEGQENDDHEEVEENPFDIDAMKDDNPFEENKDQNPENEDQDGDNDEAKEFDSDDEGVENRQNEENINEIDSAHKEDLNESEPENEESEEMPDDTEEESGLDQGQTNNENVEAMDVDNIEATDKTESNPNQKSNQPIDDLCQEDKPDKEGVGQSQMEESSSGHSAQTTKPQETQNSKRQLDDDSKKPQKPGDSNTERSLGDVNEPVNKKLKTLDNEKDNEDEGGDQNEENEDAEMYEHIKDAKEKFSQVFDVATKEQAEEQKEAPTLREEEPKESSENLPEEELVEEIEEATPQVQKPEKTEESQKKNRKNDKKQHPDGDILDELHDTEVEGDLMKTLGVSRGSESSHHTIFTNLGESSGERLTFEEITSLRVEVETQLSGWSQMPSDTEAEQAWQKISSVTSSLAQDLSEQLRLVLEPTQASRLRGDFRTGRRINMRKVIPYIASQFRKDKIWLRRTKPSKRDYQIALAIDDSSSMADNRSKELAFESVALISKSLTMLESGQLSVLSFGENTEILHKLSDQFTDSSGVKLLQKFRFDQNKTCIGKLVDFSVEMFNQNPGKSTSQIAKLLIVVSDGRGVFSEGETFVREAVRRAKLSEVFMVFVIVDNPENKHSVLDIRMPTFKDGKLLGIQSYMDVFPFSFYIILRDINALPSVLSDALRQWFEIVTNLDKQ